MELPRLEPLWNKYQDKGLSIIAIEATGDRERAVKFIEENQLTYHLLEADEDKHVIKKKFGVKWFPTSYLVDREGRILICHVGFTAGDEKKLEKEIIQIAGIDPNYQGALHGDRAKLFQGNSCSSDTSFSEQKTDR